MQDFGVRFIYAFPMLFILGMGCSDESEAIPAGDAGPAVDAAVGTDAAAGDAATTTLTVSIPPGAAGLGTRGYVPNPAVVTAGSTVMWRNDDSVAHTATSMTGLWDSGSIAPGGTYSRRFADRGTFPYYCTIHGAAAQSGTITVE
jgi:plastocyanin